MQPVSIGNTGPKVAACALLAIALAGCSLFEGSGQESSDLSITNRSKCDVDLKQAARAAGLDDTDVVEDINVKPDCTVVIKFRSLTGDSVVELETGDVLYGGQERSNGVPDPEGD